MDEDFIDPDCPSNDPMVAELKSQLEALDLKIEAGDATQEEIDLRKIIAAKYEAAQEFLCHGSFL